MLPWKEERSEVERRESMSDSRAPTRRFPGQARRKAVWGARRHKGGSSAGRGGAAQDARSQELDLVDLEQLAGHARRRG
jgi:hypothetical protein